MTKNDNVIINKKLLNSLRKIDWEWLEDVLSNKDDLKALIDIVNNFPSILKSNKAMNECLDLVSDIQECFPSTILTREELDDWKFLFDSVIKTKDFAFIETFFKEYSFEISFDFLIKTQDGDYELLSKKERNQIAGKIDKMAKMSIVYNNKQNRKLKKDK